MSDKPKLTVAEIERLGNTQKVKAAVHVPLLPSDKPIPERWRERYEWKPMGASSARQCIEELGAAEAALSEAREQEDLLWEKIEALTRLVNKACLKLKMDAYPKESEIADRIIEDLMYIRGQIHEKEEAE